MYEVPPMERFASFDGTQIAYVEAADGPAVLLLHGFAADHRANWVVPGVFDALVAAGHRVIAFDARGHGESEKPHDPAAYAGDAMANDARALLDHLGVDAVAVVGYSMGAIVASRLVPEEPRARALVLGGIGGRLAAGSPVTRRSEIAEALLADNPRSLTNVAAKAFRRFADRTGADRHALAAIQRAPLAEGPSRFGDIHVPTLVIVGAGDTLAGDPQALADRIPGATAHIVGGDHLTAVADPAFRTTIVDFLARIPHTP
ncbi:MAG: alpha/beta hydrolase [Actinomycetia bacterium]|nr:alpha/beta hydrolase [Actinomycetes bacterium]